MKQDAMMVFRLPENTKAALLEAANVEQRSASNLLVLIATQWLATNGHLNPKASSRRPRHKNNPSRRQKRRPSR
jgi:hypothetical protein